MFPRAPRLVSFPCFSTAPSRFLSRLFSRGNSVEISWFGPQISQIGKMPGYFADFLGFASDFAPDLSDSRRRNLVGLQKSLSQTQGNSRHESCQMEHQTPSSFPGNFRKRKVLGTLSFPFWFPETWIQAKQHLERISSIASSPLCLVRSKNKKI